MSGRNPKMLRGDGVVVRHSRSCATHPGSQTKVGRRCPCGPSFTAFVHIAGEGLRRRTLHSYTEALAWRRDQLRRIYGEPVERSGRLDRAYGLLRKTEQELDRACLKLERQEAVAVRRILDDLYRAEDQILALLTGAE